MQLLEKSPLHGLCLSICDVWSTVNRDMAITNEQRTDLLVRMAMTLEIMQVSDEEFQQLRETTRDVLALDQVFRNVVEQE